MKILWIKLGGFWPANSGGRLRSFHMLSELASRHAVSVVTTHAPGENPTLQEQYLPACQKVVSIPHKATKVSSAGFPAVLARSWFSELPVDLYKYRIEEVREAARQLMEKENFDLVIADFLTAIPNLPDIGSTPMLSFSHNVEHMIWQRLYENETNPVKKRLLKIEAAKMKAYEFGSCDRADLTVTVSENDKELFKQGAPGAEIEAVATGVDTNFFKPQEITDEYSMVFSGSMDWYPNEDGIIFFIREVLPKIRERHADASLLVVGRNPSDKLQDLARQHKVDLTGTVDDIRPHVAKGSVYIVPLRIGGGTRLKIFEAMAMGQAVVSTTLGAEGLPLTDGEHFLQADGAEQLSESICDLLNDKERRRALGEAGRQLVEEKFSWPQIGRQFEGFCQRAAGAEAGSRNAEAVTEQTVSSPGSA